MIFLSARILGIGLFLYSSAIYAEESSDQGKAGENLCIVEEDADKDPSDDSSCEKKGSGEEKQEITPLKIGNLSLSTSQQPGPLVGFGENVIDAGVTTLYLLVDDYQREKGYFTDVVPSILYGITDNFSVFFNVPVAPGYKERNHRSSGLEDLFIQFEYAFYNVNQLYYTDQATIVTNVTFPTGSPTKMPPTGFGSPSFFIGATYNHTAVDWLYFGSAGAVLTTFYSNSKFADIYLYEIGFGRNIPSPCGWIFAWMFEVDGQYSSRNIVKGGVDPNSGGNIVYFTPSLWISSEKLIIQLGAGGVFTQHLYGDQSKFTYQLIGNFGWTY